MSSYNHFGCSCCGGPFNGGKCPGYSSVRSENEFVYDPNPYSYNETPNFFNQLPQHQYETYSCELCGDSLQYGFDCQTRTSLVYEQDPCNNQNFSNEQSPYYSTSLPQHFDYCKVCGGPHYSSDCQAGNTPIYDQGPCYNQNFNDDQPSFYSLNQQQQFDYCEVCEGNMRTLETNSPVNVKEHVGSNDYTEVTYDKEQCLSDHYTAPITPPAYTPSIPFLATMDLTDTLLMRDEVILARETDEFIKSSVDDLVPILRESEVTSNLKCDMPATTPLPPTDDGEVDFDINSPLGEQLVDFLIENVDVAGFPRHLEFEDISSLDLPELTPVIDESTLLIKLPLSCTDVLGDAIIDIDLLLGEQLDTFSIGDREIDFNPSRDIEELERLLADNPVSVPRVFDEPLSNSYLIPKSSKTSDLFEELIAEFGLDDLIPTEIDDRCHDSEESSSLDLPLPDPRQVCLREVKRFYPFFSTQLGNMTRVTETTSLGFHHIPSPRPAAYSPKVVMYCFYHPHLTSGDGFDHGPKVK
nr:hypothetical protein [Tanacetum cinerariifolium]